MKKNKKETVSQIEKDVIKLTAYFRVYGCDIYGQKHLGLDCGKNNLERYFCDRLNWSVAKLKRLLSMMVNGVVLSRTTSSTTQCFYLYASTRESVRQSLRVTKLFGEEPSIL